MDTRQKSVWSSHSSSPSVKSRLQHLNLFPDYIFVTLSTLPSPPNHPPPPLHPPPFTPLSLSLSHPNPPLLVFFLFPPTGSISHYSSSSSVTFGLSHPISPLKISASFLLPRLPPSPPLLPSSLPLFFLPAPVLFAPVYLHRSTRWFVLKLYVWQLGGFFFNFLFFLILF